MNEGDTLQARAADRSLRHARLFLRSLVSFVDYLFERPSHRWLGGYLGSSSGSVSGEPAHALLQPRGCCISGTCYFDTSPSWELSVAVFSFCQEPWTWVRQEEYNQDNLNYTFTSVSHLVQSTESCFVTQVVTDFGGLSFVVYFLLILSKVVGSSALVCYAGRNPRNDAGICGRLSRLHQVGTMQQISHVSSYRAFRRFGFPARCGLGHQSSTDYFLERSHHTLFFISGAFFLLAWHGHKTARGGFSRLACATYTTHGQSRAHRGELTELGIRLRRSLGDGKATGRCVSLSLRDGCARSRALTL